MSGLPGASGTADRCCATTARRSRASALRMANFNLVMKRPHDAPLFPLEPFAVHSVPFFYLARWFEEFLGGQVIDETGLRGIYGFELTRTVADRDELIDLLRDQAGLSESRANRATRQHSWCAATERRRFDRAAVTTQVIF